MQKKDLRKRAVVALLRNIRSGRAISRDPVVAQTWGETAFLRLPGLVEELLDEFSVESGQQRRRFQILRRSDVQRENHKSIAYDVGLSRSQFYRDLDEARERLAQALEERLGLCPSSSIEVDSVGGNNPRFLSIQALRDGGRFARAHELAAVTAREADDVRQRIRALCILAELETEAGSFAKARTTAGEARTSIADVTDERSRDLLEATCDLVELKTSHCQGEPASAVTRGLLLDRLRRRSSDRAFAILLTKALVAEASILFQRDHAAGALATIEEAASIAVREQLGDMRTTVDVWIRASGIRALQAERVSSALEDTSKIVAAGARYDDVRTLRLGMQMMAAHLLTLGRLEEARLFAVEAWALIELFGSTLDRLIILSNLARIEVHAGDGARALQWIDTASGLSCDAFSITQALAISRAEALDLIGQPERALAMSRSLADRVAHWPRLLGRAKLAEATALSSLQREREARACSQQAVEFSRGTAGPLLHLRALDLNVKLTGNAGSRAALNELQAALRS